MGRPGIVGPPRGIISDLPRLGDNLVSRHHLAALLVWRTSFFAPCRQYAGVSLLTSDQLPLVGCHSPRRNLLRTYTRDAFPSTSWLLGIKPPRLRSTTVAPGRQWAKNAAGLPRLNPATPSSMEGRLGLPPLGPSHKRTSCGSSTSHRNPLAAHARYEHFHVAPAATSAPQASRSPVGFPSTFQPRQQTPEMSTHIRSSLPIGR